MAVDNEDSMICRIVKLERELADVTSVLNGLRNEVASRRIVLKYPDDTDAIVLQTICGTAELELLSNTAMPRVRLVVNPSEAAVYVRDVDGIARIGLMVDDEGNARVCLRDQHMQERAELSVESDDFPKVVLYNADQSVRWCSPEQ